MTAYPLQLGCTAARHRRLGIDVVINARAGLQHLNDVALDEIELERDGRAIKDRVQRRVRMYQVCSRFFRRPRNYARIAHLIADRTEI